MQDYLTKQLITYLGNKRKLLPFISEVLHGIKTSLAKEDVLIFDGFAGSGATARLFKYHASSLIVNDLEGYSETVNRCHLANRSEVNYDLVIELIDWLNENRLHHLDDNGFIVSNYAPQDDDNIKPGERVFYTRRNAYMIDNVRRMIQSVDKSIQPYLLAPLLVEASIHNNTSGVFRGFHKKNGIGNFGGSRSNDLQRIKADIELEYPVFCERECEVSILRGDANEVVKDIQDVDVAYYDPPYNQHPYGSNYFMLNIINDYDNFEIQDGVSGISKHWNRSDYNKIRNAAGALESLLAHTKSKYTMISYNNEGLIPFNQFKDIISKYGDIEMKTQDYISYKGSRNRSNRPNKVKELLWVVKMK